MRQTGDDRYRPDVLEDKFDMPVGERTSEAKDGKPERAFPHPGCLRFFKFDCYNEPVIFGKAA